VGSSPESVEPIVYRFETDVLYYPLNISSIIPGATDITLFLLTPEPLDLAQFPLYLGQWTLPSGYVSRAALYVPEAQDKPIQFELDEDELESVDQRLADLLGGRAWLTALEASGVHLLSLDKDVKLSQASFGSTEGSAERSIPGRFIWLWVLLGLAVLGLGWLVYVRRKRASQLRWIEEYRRRLRGV